uniref:hypothetical protein n=1 Tax=Streptomyces albospinus TaxID=285515 RepID=UPI0016703191|nr:hypothetical protein [Streptomyces albospinus]
MATSTSGPAGSTPRCGSARRTPVPVLLGARLDGTEELIALAERLQESTDSY